jgi:HK97 gp10 family phage protein
MAETRIAGMKELVAALDRLPAELGVKSVWSALGGAGAEVKKDAQARAPVLAQATDTRKPGTVRDAIRVSRSKINKGQRGFYEVIVRVKPLNKHKKRAAKAAGALSGANNPDDPYYWWFLEFGTSKMAARPFLRPAFESTKTAQLSGIQRRMKAAITRHAAKIKQEVNNAT